MEIKGHVFGTGGPVLCVPVVERTPEDILKMVKKMTDRGVAMIEWRMDWFSEVEDTAAVLTVLKELEPYLGKTVFLCTFRSKAQGGERSLSKEACRELNREVAKSGVADLVDLEFFETDNPGHEIKRLRQEGVRVVCSNHNFQKTPSVREMKEQLLEMVKAGGDFAKLAVMPEEKRDVLNLMAAVVDTRKQCPGSHLIAMSMGKDGMISRLLGGWYGSEVTFASFGKTSASGQMDYEKAMELLEKMKECAGEW